MIQARFNLPAFTKHGDGYPADACPECGAVVMEDDKQRHSAWHVRLNKAMRP